MLAIPAIDLKDKRCVQLRRGDAQQSTDFGDPVEKALMWVSQGAQMLHIIDLDAAFSGGRSGNDDIIKEIVRVAQVPVQSGGGLRTLRDIEERLALGVSRVILGTVALENPELVEAACAQFPGRIICAIDVINDRVAVRGWSTSSETEPVELAHRMRDIGVHIIVYTDIQRDGMLSGPNTAATARMVGDSGMQVIASGGVSSLEDIIALKQAGCSGVVLGSALYFGKIVLEEALKAS